MKRILVMLSALLLLASPAWAQSVQPITNGPVQTLVIADDMTTNTTSALSPFVPIGSKSFYGEVVCTSGTCVQTQAIYGTNATTAINGILLCTISLSNTTRAQDACPVITAAFPKYYVISTVTSGTAATGRVYVNY